MSQAIEVKVPDIGDYKDIPVIEVLVKAGDTVERRAMTSRSSHAGIRQGDHGRCRASAAGVVKEVKVKVGV